MIQATECIPCEQMWFNFKDDPNSLEYISSYQICEDPEEIYLASVEPEEPEAPEELEETDELKEEDPLEETVTET